MLRHGKHRNARIFNIFEFLILGIDKALQNIQSELLYNTSKLTEINKRIKRDTKKLEEV